ncbi:hypothetical protein BD310DRAFT_933394 [Dichomitus squalens]|uniref:Uncharacterized protein n=1 Tax=Dichomitus squalens TaxID=114155 RepID=A0A4Q9PN15_9APHY|nr:hypothetical protein BD310DRAFT_933394 [Dichomitus squalens]
MEDDFVGDCVICREWWATGRTAFESLSRQPQPSLMRSSAHGLPESGDVLHSGEGEEQHAVVVDNAPCL